MKARSYFGALLIALVGATVFAGCRSNTNPDASPSTPVSTTKTAADPESTEGRYSSALARFTDYQERLQTYERDPKRTPAVEKFYTDYWVDPTYQLKVVDALDKGDVETRGAVTVLTTQQQTVTSTRVNFRQCVDYSTSVVTEKGMRLPDDQKSPQWRYVVMERQSSALPWKVAKLDEDTDKDRPCDVS